MQKFLYILFLFICSFVEGQNQVITQTFIDRCTGETKVVTANFVNGSAVVAFYNRVKTFTWDEYTNGTLEAWLNETYAWWENLSPCSTNQTTTTNTQNTTTNATNDASTAASNAASSTTGSTTNTNTNASSNGTSSTGSTSTDSSSTSSSSTTDSTSGSSDSSNSSSSGGDSTGGGDDQSGDTSSGSEGDSGGESKSSDGGGETEGDSSGGSEEDSSNSSGEESTEEESSTESETSEDSESEESEEVEESTEEESSEEESSEEESSEEESKEEEKEEEEKEESEEESEEEESESKEKKKRAPINVSANLATMSALDGTLSNVASFGFSQSSLTGTTTYSANMMVWDNLQQFSLGLSKSDVYFNYDKETPVFVKDNDGKLYEFGKVADRGTIMKVQSISVSGMYMFGTTALTFGISDVFLGQKDNFWKGFAGGYALSFTTIKIEDSYTMLPTIVGFATKPFPTKRVTISPMIALAANPLSYSFTNKNVFKNNPVFNEHLTYIVGSNFDVALTQRFRFNIGGNIIGNTLPGIPITWSATIGSKFQF